MIGNNLLKKTKNPCVKNIFTIHGTFLKILGQGVLVKGQSSSGKSILSLELVNRGHQLIADDAVWLEKKQQKILGKCPPQIQDFIYVKEFGIINIRKIFGTGAISMHTELKLVIQLSSTLQQNCSLTHEGYKTTSILGINIPTVTLSAGHVPPILVEIAVRDLLLRTKGYFALDEFNHQHQRFTHAYQTKNYDS